MNLSFRLEKNTCFYYWLQTVSGWDEYPPEPEAYEFYKQDLVRRRPTIKQKEALNNIKSLLKGSVDARKILSELYEDRITSTDAKKIRKEGRALSALFEFIWKDAGPWLTTQKHILEQTDFERFTNIVEQISSFLDSSFDMHKEIAVYLLQNPSDRGAAGHTISGTSSMLLHPCSESYSSQSKSLTLGTLIHEYIHLIEFESRLTRKLFQESYEEYLEQYNITIPGYTWKMVYVETIVYCFVNSITGGYLRPLIIDKPRLTVENSMAGFNKLKNDNSLSSSQLIAWVSLNLSSELEAYLKANKSIDKSFVDKISKQFLHHYSVS